MCALFDRHDPDRLFPRKLASPVDRTAKYGASESVPRLTLKKGRDTAADVQDTSPPPAHVVTSLTVTVEPTSPVRSEPMKPTPVRCVMRSVPLLDRMQLFLARASRMCNGSGGFR